MNGSLRGLVDYNASPVSPSELRVLDTVLWFPPAPPETSRAKFSFGKSVVRTTRMKTATRRFASLPNSALLFCVSSEVTLSHLAQETSTCDLRGKKKATCAWRLTAERQRRPLAQGGSLHSCTITYLSSRLTGPMTITTLCTLLLEPTNFGSEPFSHPQVCLDQQRVKVIRLRQEPISKVPAWSNTKRQEPCDGPSRAVPPSRT